MIKVNGKANGVEDGVGICGCVAVAASDKVPMVINQAGVIRLGRESAAAARGLENAAELPDNERRALKAMLGVNESADAVAAATGAL